MSRVFYRRFEFWLIVAACVASFVIGLAGCDVQRPPVNPRNDGDRAEVERSHVVQTYRVQLPVHLSGTDVTEFEDSMGRRCVYIDSGYSGALSCGYPRGEAPLAYEDLPDVPPEPEYMPRPR